MIESEQVERLGFKLKTLRMVFTDLILLTDYFETVENFCA